MSRRTSEGVRKSARIDVKRIKELEEIAEHEFVAFIKSITEKLDENGKRFFHYGLTSSGVIDTALSLAISESYSILLKDLDGLLSSLWKLADRHRRTPIIGRTHGVHAEMTSFGLKVLSWYAELSRGMERLKRACEEARVGKISGAVGNYANVPLKVKVIAFSRLNLCPTPVFTQVVPRDYHANFVFTVAWLGRPWRGWQRR